MTRADDNAIVVESLTKRYGDLAAVDDVSFTVKRGEVFAFLGTNGAGKTTTVEIIETVRAPTSGRALVLGMDVTTNKRGIVPRIGVLPQNFNSFDRITVRESLRYYARLFGRSHADVEALLDLTGLGDTRDVQFMRLSGGLKQRLGIAIALVNDPEVVFLDEPTTGLDPHARRAMWDVLLGLKRRGKAVFLTTHYMEEAELLADTVAIISRGKIVATGSPAQLVERNANYVWLTLKSVSARALEELRTLGLTPAPDDHANVTLRVRDSDAVLRILSAISAAGAPLPGVDVRKPNLEEVFLRVAAGDQGDGAAGEGRAA